MANFNPEPVMKLLIHLPENRFAFYDTKTKLFDTFGRSQSWDNFSQFILDFRYEVETGTYKYASDINSYRDLTKGMME